MDKVACGGDKGEEIRKGKKEKRRARKKEEKKRKMGKIVGKRK
jgi:hypothetical protein